MTEDGSLPSHPDVPRWKDTDVAIWNRYNTVEVAIAQLIVQGGEHGYVFVHHVNPSPHVGIVMFTDDPFYYRDEEYHQAVISGVRKSLWGPSQWPDHTLEYLERTRYFPASAKQSR